MSTTRLQVLRTANRTIQTFLEACATAGPEGASRAISSEQIARLLYQVERAGQIVFSKEVLASIRAEETAELAEYAGRLEGLQGALIAAQDALRAQRSVMDLERRHLSCASAWATSQRETL